ncbi:Platelet-activating factor acetylhydrolase IB subunit gamma [Nymphon striatum]|nr:Platelet-activating factor acetylhydrolase IB subunit gamma [Nymphon striatum]
METIFSLQPPEINFGCFQSDANSRFFIIQYYNTITLCMHNQFLSEAKEKEPEVLFIGDSIIERLIMTDIWRKQFAFLHCLNFGIGGDHTQHLLWRLLNGELDHVAPKVVVLLIGTNNTSIHTPEQISDGILHCVEVISKKQPQASIVVLVS